MTERMPGEFGTPVTLAECRLAVEKQIRNPEYLMLLLGWAVRELEAKTIVPEAKPAERSLPDVICAAFREAGIEFDAVVCLVQCKDSSMVETVFTGDRYKVCRMLYGGLAGLIAKPVTVQPVDIQDPHSVTVSVLDS